MQGSGRSPDITPVTMYLFPLGDKIKYGHFMNKLRFVVSLTNNDNDYQMEQASAAEKTAQRLGIDAQIIHANNDAILQSQQLLKIVQASSGRPDGIIVEPVGGTALPQVARAAAAAGIGWVILNRDAEYVSELRRSYRVPVFSITSDHIEIGRLQGKQLGALLPKGGSVLYIQGPSESLAAKQRAQGMNQSKPSNIEIKVIKGQWTETSAHKAVSSWLRLSTSRESLVDVIAAQDDSMAMGSKKAFQDIPDNAARERWMKIPYIGIDGVPTTGQAWVRSGLLTATVIVPANSGQAIEALAKAIQQGSMPSEQILIAPTSFPSIEELSSKATRARSHSV
jgi:ribose transport system substrate-binding protein